MTEAEEKGDFKNASTDPTEDRSIPEDKECLADGEIIDNALQIIEKEIRKCDDRYHRAGMAVIVMKALLLNAIRTQLDIAGTLKLLEIEIQRMADQTFFFSNLQRTAVAVKKAEKEYDEKKEGDIKRMTQ